MKQTEKASDIDIRRGQKQYPLAGVSNGGRNSTPLLVLAMELYTF